MLPTMETVESYFQMLMAEMETLSLVPEAGTAPAIKALQQVGGGVPHRSSPTDGLPGVSKFEAQSKAANKERAARSDAGHSIGKPNARTSHEVWTGRKRVRGVNQKEKTKEKRLLASLQRVEMPNILVVENNKNNHR